MIDRCLLLVQNNPSSRIYVKMLESQFEVWDVWLHLHLAKNFLLTSVTRNLNYSEYAKTSWACIVMLLFQCTSSYRHEFTGQRNTHYIFLIFSLVDSIVAALVDPLWVMSVWTGQYFDRLLYSLQIESNRAATPCGRYSYRGASSGHCQFYLVILLSKLR